MEREIGTDRVDNGESNRYKDQKNKKKKGREEKRREEEKKLQ